MTDLEKTLILVKPDGVRRRLVGRIIQRFEDAGFRLSALDLRVPDEELAGNHYGQDIADEHGDDVRDQLIDFLTNGPVVALVFAGVDVVENGRKMVGDTEPKSAEPGTIRGDFTHVNYDYADDQQMAVKNVVHASATPEEAKAEIGLWFDEDEIVDYEANGDKDLF